MAEEAAPGGRPRLIANQPQTSLIVRHSSFITLPEFRQDPLSQRWVVIAPERASRPHDVDQSGGAPRPCPFCAGGESHTPHESLAIREPGTAPDSQGWRVRVVPNKYPGLVDDGSLPQFAAGTTECFGLGVHEVILESPRHLRSTTEQTPSEVAEVLTVYRDRLRTLQADPRWKYATIFKNVGAAAGASLEHLHSQLVVMPVVPQTIQESLIKTREYQAQTGHCYYCDLLARELADGRRIVFATPDFVALCPAAARFAYETWLVPRRHAAHFGVVDADDLAHLAGSLLSLLRRLESRLQRPAYNYLLRTAPFDIGASEHYHWHVEVFPRVTTLAGFELSTDFFINIVRPEDAAADLRQSDC